MKEYLFPILLLLSGITLCLLALLGFPFSFAVFILGAASTLLASYLLAYRQGEKSYTIHMGEHAMTIDREAVDQTLGHYWQQEFPGAPITGSCRLQRGKIHVHADFPSESLEDQRSILQKLEREIGALIRAQLGLSNEVILSITFGRENA